ncbi:MAG: hypothetical protein LBJ93_00145, partial [Clostridiales bacterium]|nr:hypothetical protein [Clostridiales bacterium]
MNRGSTRGITKTSTGHTPKSPSPRKPPIGSSEIAGSSDRNRLKIILFAGWRYDPKHNVLANFKMNFIPNPILPQNDEFYCELFDSVSRKNRAMMRSFPFARGEFGTLALTYRAVPKINDLRLLLAMSTCLILTTFNSSEIIELIAHEQRIYHKFISLITPAFPTPMIGLKNPNDFQRIFVSRFAEDKDASVIPQKDFLIFGNEEIRLAFESSKRDVLTTSIKPVGIKLCPPVPAEIGSEIEYDGYDGEEDVEIQASSTPEIIDLESQLSKLRSSLGVKEEELKQKSSALEESRNQSHETITSLESQLLSLQSSLEGTKASLQEKEEELKQKSSALEESQSQF